MESRELIIINGKAIEISQLGWNPKQCNPEIKKMVDGKKLRHKYMYRNKNSDDRILYTHEQLAKKYGLGLLDNRLYEIEKEQYESFSIEADWVEEGLENDEVVWDEQ